MKKTILLLTLLLFVSGFTYAEDEEATSISFSQQYYAGGRLGVWVNNGDTPQEIIDDGQGYVIQSSIKDASFYLEGYFGYKLLPLLFGEFSFGVVNRGSVTIQDGSFNDYGNLLVYPFLIKAKLYPLASFHSRFQPYVGIGGGVYYGRHSIQFTNNIYSYYGYNNQSATDLNYTITGGVDWLVSQHFSIDGNMTYLPIDFSDELIGIKDYKALSITIGVKYRYK